MRRNVKHDEMSVLKFMQENNAQTDYQSQFERCPSYHFCPVTAIATLSSHVY